MPSLAAALWTAAGFLAGSIPFGVIVSRAFFGRDIRASGSGNIGAANALRSLGAKGGAAVLILDALKGFIPVFFVPAELGPEVRAAVAFAAVAGHCYSPWLGGKGGKGVATLLGALFAYSWPAGLSFMLIWIAVFAIAGYASLSSLIAGVSAGAWFFVSAKTPYAGAFWFAAALVIVWKHRANIERLRDGTESKLTLKSPREEAGKDSRIPGGDSGST
jgi:glycerol-3-phosphate acyltransferase PlsY